MTIQEIYNKMQSLHPTISIKIDFCVSGITVELQKFDDYLVQKSFYIDKGVNFTEEFNKQFETFINYGTKNKETF
jgi:hypothetical protein